MARAHVQTLRLVRILLLGVAMSSGLIGCSSESVAPRQPLANEVQATITVDVSAASTPTVDTVQSEALELIRRASETMRSLKSYHFVELDMPGSRDGGRIEGDFVAPDRLRTITKNKPTETSVIAIGKDCYAKQQGNSTYESVYQPIVFGCKPPHEDLLPTIAALKSVEILDEEIIEGVETSHFRYVFDSASAQGTTPGMLGESAGHIWIEVRTGYIRQHELTMFVGRPMHLGPTIYSNFNEPVVSPIELP